MGNEILKEKQNITTDASRGFLSKWGKEIISSLNAVNIGAWSFLAGMDVMLGNNEAALLKGIVTGCFVVATVLRGHSMAAENRLLKDQANQFENQGKR